MTLILEDAEARYHKPVIFHCALCVLIIRFQLTFFSNFITIVVVVYSGVRLELPIAMHTGIIKRNTQCMYR